MIRHPRVNQRCEVVLPGRGSNRYPAKVTGYSTDHNGNVTEIEAALLDGFNWANPTHHTFANDDSIVRSSPTLQRRYTRLARAGRLGEY